MFFRNSLAFFDTPTYVGNLISGSSAFSKTSCNIWKFSVHVLLKPGLENLEHCFTSVWDECNCGSAWYYHQLHCQYWGFAFRTTTAPMRMEDFTRKRCAHAQERQDDTRLLRPNVPWEFNQRISDDTIFHSSEYHTHTTRRNFVPGK